MSSTFVTLAEVLEARGGPLGEEEIWSLLLGTAEAMVDLSYKGEHTHTHTHTQRHMHMHTHIHTDVHIYTHKHTHLYTHTPPHTHTHIQWGK